jgi:hypothetical protein
MLERFGMQDCQPCKTRAAVHSNKDYVSTGESLSEEDTQRYRSIIGSLMYAMIGTRPDIVAANRVLDQACIKISNDDVVQAQTEHINVWCHFLRQFCKIQAHLLPY